MADKCRSANPAIPSVSRERDSLKSMYIMFSVAHECPSITFFFYSIQPFPNVIGALYCPVEITVNPGGQNGERFFKSKGFHSLNVQAVSKGEGRKCFI